MAISDTIDHHTWISGCHGDGIGAAPSTFAEGNGTMRSPDNGHPVGRETGSLQEAIVREVRVGGGGWVRELGLGLCPDRLVSSLGVERAGVSVGE